MPAFKSKQMEKAVVYLRVSTEEQVDNYSLDTQKEICAKEAERRGLELVEVFKEEGRSAKTVAGRPELVRLLEFCRKNKRSIDAVIVYRLDRISRQTSDYLAIRRKLSECDISLISATEPTGNSPTEKFVETMLAGFAQMDNDVRSERTTNGMRARFMSGLKNGPPPLGYLNRNGYAAENPEAFQPMFEAWELMGTGTTSLQGMADILNAKGLRERKNGRENLIRPQTLNGIFRNKFYAGKIVSKRWGEEVQGQYKPMVSEELFYRVQAVLDGKNRNAVPLARRSRDNPSFPLRRIVRCGVCGGPLTGAFSKGKHRRFGYYFCQKRCRIGAKSSIPSVTVEEEMKNLLTRISPKPETSQLLNAFLRKTYHERVANLQKRREEADVELKKLHGFRQALVEKNLSGVYSDEIFKEQNKAIEEKIQAVYAAKDDALIDKYSLEAVTGFIAAKLSNVPETYEKSDLDQKKVLLCSIFPAGVRWGENGYSNTETSPYWSALLELENEDDQFGAQNWI